MNYICKQLKEPFVLDSGTRDVELSYSGPSEKDIFLDENGYIAVEGTLFTLQSSNDNHILLMDMLDGCNDFIIAEHEDTETMVEVIPNMKRRVNTIYSPFMIYSMANTRIVDGVVEYEYLKSYTTHQDIVDIAQYELEPMRQEIIIQPTEEARAPYRKCLAILQWIIDEYTEEKSKIILPHYITVPNTKTVNSIFFS